MTDIIRLQLEPIMDIDTALERVAGNEQLLLLLLSKMAQDTSPYELKVLFRNGQTDELFEKAHKLKGAVSNLSLDKLYQSISLVVEKCRKGDFLKLNESLDMFLDDFEKFCTVVHKITL